MNAAGEFWARVDKNGPELREGIGACWVWTGPVLKRTGYGRVLLGSRKDGTRRRELAHRYAFFLVHGRDGEPCVLHLCDNPRCVRVERGEGSHLHEGTKAENLREAIDRGRWQPNRGVANGRTKLDAEAKHRLFGMRAAGLSQVEIGAVLGVTHARVGQILRARR